MRRAPVSERIGAPLVLREASRARSSRAQFARAVAPSRPIRRATPTRGLAAVGGRRAALPRVTMRVIEWIAGLHGGRPASRSPAVTVWSLTPSRMGIIAVRLTSSKESPTGRNRAGISLGSSEYVAGLAADVLAASSGESDYRTSSTDSTSICRNWPSKASG
jgi:hypothetical protein